MSWVKLDDAFLDHPKFLRAGPLAGYLCLCSIAWSNRNRTDGRIPRSQVRRFVDFDGFAHRVWMGELVGGGEDVDAMELAEMLVNVGLWERDGDGFRIHDYHDWQRSSDEIDALTEQRREAGKKGGRARAQSVSSGKSSEVSLDGSSSKSSSGSSGISSSASSSKTEAEVRRKKEEVKTPPTPPQAGGRKRTVSAFTETATVWAATAGVTGDQAVLIRAYRQAGAWKQPDPAQHFRGFCRQHFPTLTIEEEPMAAVHPLPERAA